MICLASEDKRNLIQPKLGKLEQECMAAGTGVQTSSRTKYRRKKSSVEAGSVAIPGSDDTDRSASEEDGLEDTHMKL